MSQANGRNDRALERQKTLQDQILTDVFLLRIAISCIWTGTLLYASYHVYLVAEANLTWQKDPVMNPGPFTKLLKRGRDTTDHEWTMFTEAFFTVIIFWDLSYIILNRAIQQSIPQLSPSFSAVFCYAFLCRLIGIWPSTFLLIQPVVFWLLLRLRSKSIIWIWTMLYLYFLNSSFAKLIVPTANGLPEYYFFITAAWNAARCISFSFDTWEDKDSGSTSSLVSFTHYVFYYPLSINGPLLLYDKFQKSLFVQQAGPKNREEIIEEFRTLGLKIARSLIWVAVIEILLHYLYFRPLALTPPLLYEINWWALCGTVFWLGQFFQMKYVVMYGIPSAIAEFEGMEMPPLPRCISHIHRYSVLWKDFDRGLYHFLVRYTYLPTLRLLDRMDKQNMISVEFRRLMASFSSFVYVYVWHSTSYDVFVWAAFNFFGITMERIGSFVKRKVDSIYEVNQILWDVVFEPFVTIPLAVMSVLNSVVFTGTMLTAQIVMYRFFSELSEHYVLHFLYCFTHTGVLVRTWPTVYTDLLRRSLQPILLTASGCLTAIRR